MNPQILIPFNPAEALDVSQAARRAKRTDRTIRSWCEEHHIGRRVPAGGHWRVSAVALQMLLEGDDGALQAYLGGDRESDRVLSYYGRLRISATASNKSAKSEVSAEAT